MNEKSAVVIAVDGLVQDKTAAVDIDSIELYEWALQDAWLPTNYSKTIGALRARWAKANPSSPDVVACLEACVREWDLVNAQQVSRCPSISTCLTCVTPQLNRAQIAAIMDKGASGKQESKAMFWNITLTHLLSVGRPPYRVPLRSSIF